MIYVVKHKDYNSPLPEGYKALEVGPLFKDHDTDNINDLNPYINELTGLYWIWKNTSDDFVGLCHYRRYFTVNDEIMTFNQAKEILKGHDIITTTPAVFDRSLYDILVIDSGGQQGFETYRDMFFKAVPGFEDYLKNTNKVNPRNMFFCRKELIDKYCEWIFPIVIPIARRYKAETIPKNNNLDRLIGYIAERLMSYWLLDLDCVEIEYKGV